MRVTPIDRKPQTPRSSSSFVNTRVGSAGERAQQRELLLRQLDALAADGDLARRRVDLERTRRGSARRPARRCERRSSAATRARSSA